MRAADTYTESLFTVKRLEDFIPQNHPLRPIRKMVNEALGHLEGFLSGMYAAQSQGGRPAIAPEKLLRAMLLQVVYSIRSERQLMEQTQYNLLYRWFIGLAMDDPVWVPTVFTKNRARLLEHDAVIELFNEVLMLAERGVIQAWASHKSFVRKDGDDQDGDNFKGKPRSNETRASRTDADARLYRKGNTGSELRYMGHTLSDNRHGLIASAVVTSADGHAEREAAKAMINDAVQATNNPEAHITLGADKGYDAKAFIEALTDMKVTPHVAQNTSGRRSAVPGEIANTEG
ncbi:MAG: IS5 family transposase, partial [Betaproteobacteria bacterium]|nr:IS5 family transposase [Betaproteobacteria bacterium]